MRIKEPVKTFAEWLFRWVPSTVEPGLRVFGNPDENSPVFLTCNYGLTVKRVSKYLKKLNCYLLVAPSKGINVWCAACGKEFNEFSVISAIKTSGISEKVKHRILIAPQLSAPGIDIKKVKEETGWNVRFGPVYAEDIPEYVRRNFRKTEKMRLVEFKLKDRLEMATIYFFTMGLIFLRTAGDSIPKHLPVHDYSNRTHDLLYVHSLSIFPRKIRIRKGSSEQIVFLAHHHCFLNDNYGAILLVCHS